ncbi:MAG: tetratricopeptide repeat protein, partial [Kiritimatiellae bacterium]|nr:tetratricopeptide repeat protein [Kiritimatiellia bacterium]
RADEAAAAEYGRIAASENAAPALRAAARLAQGLVHYRMGLYLEALGDFRAVSAASPAGGPGVQAEFMQAWCLYLLGKDAEALAACQAFLRAHPDSEFAPDARFWIGEQSFNNGDWAAAEKAFSGLAEAHPDSAAAPEAMYWAGMAAARASEYLLANERFNALLAGWPGHPRTEAALLAQGDVLAELGQFPAAILAFDEVLRTFPHGEGAMAAWGRKGDCLYTLGETEPARREEALLSYRALHDFADAPEDLHLQAGYKIGRCLENMGHEAEAAEQYMETVYEYLGRREASGEDAEGWAGSAAGGIAGGRPESGVWFTRSAFAAGALLERMGRKSEALGVYRRVAESGAPAAPEAVERARRLEGERGVGAAGGE